VDYWSGAVPTEYGGVRFRSLLEARWAVVFDELGIPWEYEPQRFGAYLPDFRLFGSVYVEVKPPLGTFDHGPHERRWRQFVLDQDSPLLIAYGVPRVDAYPIWLGFNGEVSKEFADLSAFAQLGPGYSSPHPPSEVFSPRLLKAAVKQSFEFGAAV
jgi:hypothetical protein